MADVTIVVSTFGGDNWRDLAAERAIPSAKAQDVPVVVSHHSDSLHHARNNGLAAVDTEWTVFLDADDELEHGYVNKLMAGTCDLRAPSVRYIKPGWDSVGAYVPKVAGHDHACEAACLSEGNWLVVGSMARTDLLRRVGGWRDFAVYEDWDLWLRCHLAGATFEAIPAAVYRAHVRAGSRNRGPSQQFRNDVHRQIIEANYGAEATA